MSKRPIYAHRGYVKYAPENTLQAMKDAIEKTNAKGIELDLQLTKDRIAIVTHDLNLKRLTGLAKDVNECTLNEIRKLKVKRSSEKICTFSELLEWAVTYQIPLNIELKESFIGRFADIEIIVKKSEHLPDVHFSSFHIEILKQIKDINPKLETAFIPTRKFNWNTLKNLSFIDTLHVNKRFYYKEKYFEIARNTNKKLRFYGVTGREKWLQQPQHTSIVGFITDNPNEVAYALK